MRQGDKATGPQGDRAAGPQGDRATGPQGDRGGRGGRRRSGGSRELLGVGVDTERRDALARFDDAAIVRFAERWLAPGERAWCAAQADVRQAMVLCVAAKEAVWKAVGGAVPLQRIEVAGRTGLRSRIGVPGADVRLRLETPPGAGGDVVATAMAIRRRDA